MCECVRVCVNGNIQLCFFHHGGENPQKCENEAKYFILTPVVAFLFIFSGVIYLQFIHIFNSMYVL